MSKVRTRIAPTPSGFLHEGNIHNFKIIAEAARRVNGIILLRIDDLDAPRVRAEYILNIFETLRELDIHCEEGPHTPEDLLKHWSQALRVSNYHALINQLVNYDLVYACMCSRLNFPECRCQQKGISPDTPGSSLRLKHVTAGVSFMNTEGEPLTYPFPEEMQGVVIRRRDGLPSYQIASLSDDVQFNINLIIRGEDLLPSTLVQMYLANILGLNAFETARFHHHELITDGRGRKLSKSSVSS